MSRFVNVLGALGAVVSFVLVAPATAHSSAPISPAASSSVQSGAKTIMIARGTMVGKSSKLNATIPVLKGTSCKKGVQYSLTVQADKTVSTTSRCRNGNMQYTGQVGKTTLNNLAVGTSLVVKNGYVTVKYPKGHAGIQPVYPTRETARTSHVFVLSGTTNGRTDITSEWAYVPVTGELNERTAVNVLLLSDEITGRGQILQLGGMN